MWRMPSVRSRSLLLIRKQPADGFLDPCKDAEGSVQLGHHFPGSDNRHSIRIGFVACDIDPVIGGGRPRLQPVFRKERAEAVFVMGGWNTRAQAANPLGTMDATSLALRDRLQGRSMARTSHSVSLRTPAPCTA